MHGKCEMGARPRHIRECAMARARRARRGGLLGLSRASRLLSSLSPALFFATDLRIPGSFTVMPWPLRLSGVRPRPSLSLGKGWRCYKGWCVHVRT